MNLFLKYILMGWVHDTEPSNERKVPVSSKHSYILLFISIVPTGQIVAKWWNFFRYIYSGHWLNELELLIWEKVLVSFSEIYLFGHLVQKSEQLNKEKYPALHSNYLWWTFFIYISFRILSTWIWTINQRKSSITSFQTFFIIYFSYTIWTNLT